MRGVVQYALAPEAVELRELPVPELEDDDVLLRVRGASVCGSDVHQYHNKQSWTVNVPVVLGHEFGGEVARVGRRVRGFKEGDRVVSETAASICGACVYCRAGEYNLCPKRSGFGYGTHGGMAEYARVPARFASRVTDLRMEPVAGWTMLGQWRLAPLPARGTDAGRASTTWSCRRPRCRRTRCASAVGTTTW